MRYAIVGQRDRGEIDAADIELDGAAHPSSRAERHRHRSCGQSDVLDPGRPIREADIARCLRT